VTRGKHRQIAWLLAWTYLTLSAAGEGLHGLPGMGHAVHCGQVVLWMGGESSSEWSGGSGERCSRTVCSCPRPHGEPPNDSRTAELTAAVPWDARRLLSDLQLCGDGQMACRNARAGVGGPFGRCRANASHRPARCQAPSKGCRPADRRGEPARAGRTDVAPFPKQYSLGTHGRNSVLRCCASLPRAFVPKHELIHISRIMAMFFSVIKRSCGATLPPLPDRLESPSLRTSPRVHAGRVTGGDRDHRRAGGLCCCRRSRRPGKPRGGRNALTT
jgi:hypothetical protein